MGTPDFAVPALRAVAAACDLAAIVTQPDRPRGRGLAAAPSAVAEAALELGAPVLKPEDMRAASVAGELKKLGADLFAVVAFGAILSSEVLRLPRLGCINLHGSLLPDYRGASPVQRALWDGRVASGVTTLWMDEGIDTGDLIAQRWVAIQPDDDAGSLGARLAETGAPLLAENLTAAFEGRGARVPQRKDAGSYARKLSKRDGLVDWTLDAATIWCHQRAVTPWPGATTAFRGARVRLERTSPEAMLPSGAAAGTVLGTGAYGVRVACGLGTLCISTLKPEGRATMDAADWARGARLQAGERFTALEENTT